MYNEDDSQIVRDVTSLATRLTLFVKTSRFKDITTDVTLGMIAEELERRENRGKGKRKKRRVR